MKNVREANVLIGRERAGNKEHVTITDKETGEIIKQYWVEEREKPSGRPPDKGRAPEFYKLYATNFNTVVDKLVVKKKVSLYDAGVLFCLFRFIDWESNFLVHPQSKKNMTCRMLADYLGISRSVLMESIERLNERGLIAVVSLGKGRPNHYILNTNVIFKGHLIKNISEHDRFMDDELPVRVKYKEREKDV